MEFGISKDRERIELSDSFINIASKLSEGNPGALNVIMTLVKESPTIDPDAAMGPFAHLLSLDSFGIYGSNIWILYKDICGQDITNMIAVLRAIQLGILPIGMLKRAIGGINGNTKEAVVLDVPGLLEKVRDQLPRFGKAA